MIADYEREQILKAGSFLKKKGYKVKVDEYGVDYSNDNVQFSFAYPPYENVSEVSITFIDANDAFSVSWIAFVREQLKTDGRKKLLNILTLMEFIEKHYEEIINYEYCKESRGLVDKYVAQHPEIFEKAVQDFLESCRKS